MPINNHPIRYECAGCGRRQSRPSADGICYRCRHKVRLRLNVDGLRDCKNARRREEGKRDNATMDAIDRAIGRRRGRGKATKQRIDYLADRAARGLPLFG